jgi:multiple sugar transport system substrate-binding protein
MTKGTKRGIGTDRDVTRRSVLQAGIGAAGLAATGGIAFPSPAIAQAAGFDWKRFKGEHLEVLMAKGPRGDLLQQYRKEFEALTGMTVGDEQVPEQQQRQKTAIEFNSGNTSFDVVMIPYHVQKVMFGKNKWLVDLRPYLADAKLTAPDYDVADFAKGGMDYATQADGRLDSMPINLDYWMIYWNKEIFAQKGVAYPKNFDELMVAAEKLNDQKNGISGFLGRGIKNANVPVWTSFLLGYGVDPIGKGGTLPDGPEAVAAAAYYKKIVHDYGPPGVVQFNWNECQSLFVLGKAAMWLDGIGFALPMEDPAKSKVVGKVGYGVMPAGPKAQHSALFGDGMAISAFTKKKEAAWLYVQWATNKEMQARNLIGGYGSPGRNSAFETAKTATLKAPRDWLDCMSGSIKIARPGLPEIVAVTEFRDIYGIGLTNMLQGGDPATELKKASEQFKPILAKENG